MSDELCVLDGEMWRPALSDDIVGALRTACHIYGKPFKPTRVKDYLRGYKEELTPELLIEDIPAWDGKDRIHEMCTHLNIKEPLTNQCFEDIFKEWCSNMYAKIYEPETTQNLCIVLSGAQGIGKDVWIDSFFWILKSYINGVEIDKHGGVKKFRESSRYLAIAFISEFDKLCQLDPAELKELVTSNRYRADFKYERSQSYVNRTSILGATNSVSRLKDVSGNRRFMIFELDGGVGQAIRWKYPKYDKRYSLYILSQIKELAAGNYQACPEHKEMVARKIEVYTPENPIEDLIDDAVVRLEKINKWNGKQVWQASDKEFREIILDLSRDHSMKPTDIKRHLKANGFWLRTAQARLWATPDVIKEGATTVLQFWSRGNDTFLED
jgi:hypothetical protein